MNRQNLVGREYELGVMEQLFRKDDAVLMSIYGRRRVGKTFLVKCFLEEQYDFYFTGMYKALTAVLSAKSWRTFTSVTLYAFTRAMARRSGK